MISRNDPRQGHLLDPWEHLGPKRRKLLENSWAGLFRQEILAELPVNQIAPWFRADFARPSKELYTVLGVLGLKAVRFCATLKTVGVNLFRATAVRRASNRAAVTGPGSKSRFSRFVSRVKEQITAMDNAIDQFFIPDAYSGPVELKMAA